MPRQGTFVRFVSPPFCRALAGRTSAVPTGCRELAGRTSWVHCRCRGKGGQVFPPSTSAERPSPHQPPNSGPEARVPRRFARHGRTGFGNAEADAGRNPACPGALRRTDPLVSAMSKQMRARGPSTQALCGARAHWFRQCRSRCGPKARVPRRFALRGALGYAMQMPAESPRSQARCASGSLGYAMQMPAESPRSQARCAAVTAVAAMTSLGARFTLHRSFGRCSYRLRPSFNPYRFRE